jgi:hypothetical protein
MRPLYASGRAQAIGVSRADVATAPALDADGVPAGSIREGDHEIYILVRTPRSEMTEDGRIREQIVFAPVTGAYVPLDRVIDGFAVIARRDRLPTLRVQATRLWPSPKCAARLRRCRYRLAIVWYGVASMKVPTRRRPALASGCPSPLAPYC